MTELLNWSDDRLLETLGDSLHSETLEAFPFPRSKEEAREIAVQWLSDKRSDLQAAICGDKRIRNLLGSPARELIFRLVCDLLVARFTGIHIGALAAYLVNRGLDGLCSGYKVE